MVRPRLGKRHALCGGGEPETVARGIERANTRLAQALGEANHARQDAVEQADRLRLLDQVSGVLGSSLDYEATVAATARLAVPAFADWCSVDVLVDGEIKQLGAAHLDTPALQRLSEVRQHTTLSPGGGARARCGAAAKLTKSAS